MKMARLISMILVLSVLYACEPVTNTSSDTSTSDKLVPDPEPFTASMSMGKTDQNKGLAALRRATARYHDVTAAIEDGFEQILPCTENPNGEGALGVVYANLDRFDTTIDLNKPEVLFYEPRKNGDLRLVGGEPVVPIEQWDEIESNPPSLFGHEFHRNEAHGLYGLHMWVWKNNPEGIFAFWHPDVSCEHAQ